MAHRRRPGGACGRAVRTGGAQGASIESVSIAAAPSGIRARVPRLPMPRAPIRPVLAPLLLACATALLVTVGTGARAQPAARPAPPSLPAPSEAFAQAVRLMDAGRDAEAAVAFERVAQDWPELPEPWNNLALLHARAGRLDEARVALETALRNDPGHVAARANLAEVHLRLALRAWEQAAAAAPDDAALQRRVRLAREWLATPR